MPTASTTITINNRLGMHARPAMLFAEIAGKFSSSITVGHEKSDQVDAKSIMQLMMLAAVQGTKLTINANGEDADDAITELTALVSSEFHE
ncbi:MAG: HPr family phosphocarrier protein [Phycisphaerales bacterium]|nr:HPr family phosphocarrier protein [Planctomycetota bacterium]MBL6997532.1 HPr family phosphocarrier protein [Phycisphaerales bacterium]